MLDQLKDSIPLPVRRRARHAWEFSRHKLTESWTAKAIYYDLRDAWDRLLGHANPLVPPRKLVFGIGGDLFVGERFVQLFREKAGLLPGHDVLDVGCGIGRIALPLTTYLNLESRYEGFDIVKANVAWCRKAITPRFPNFHFQHADIFNREYNPLGRLKGESFRFPYPDGSFDFVLLTSVFTHLLPDVVSHYLGEISRVLRPDGRCFATVYLLNETTNRLLAEGRAKFTLEPSEGLYRVHNRVIPEACVALDEAWYRDSARAAGFTKLESFAGMWSGHEPWLDFQDIVVMEKG